MPRSPFFGSTTRRCPVAVGVCRPMHRGLCLSREPAVSFFVRSTAADCAVVRGQRPSWHSRSGAAIKNTAGMCQYLRFHILQHKKGSDIPDE